MNPPSDREPFDIDEESLVSHLSDMEVSMPSDAFKAKADAYKTRAPLSLGFFGRPSPRVSRGRSNTVSSFYHPHIDTPRPPRNDVNANTGATPFSVFRSSDTANAKRGSANPRARKGGKPRSHKTPASLPKILALRRSQAGEENLSPMLPSPTDIKTPHRLAGFHPFHPIGMGSGESSIATQQLLDAASCRSTSFQPYARTQTTPRTNAVSPLRVMTDAHQVKRPVFMSPLVKSPKKEQSSH